LPIKKKRKKETEQKMGLGVKHWILEFHTRFEKHFKKSSLEILAN
jgi:hypothetical protein